MFSRHSITRLCVVFVSLFVFPFPALSAFYPSSHTTLENGLSVLVAEMPSSPMVSVYALVKTGSATEGEFLGSGISHFFEHMLFKTTTNRRVGEIASDIQAVGGTINASTGLDYTIYTITVPNEGFDTALDVLSDMLMNITMDPEEVEKERQVIFGEMRLYRDNPDRELSRYVFQNVYIKHPYQHPVIGYEPLFASITRDDLVNYYKTHYAPNNTILSIAGGIKAASVLPKVEKVFKDFKRQRPVLRNLPAEPTQLTPRFFEVEYPTDLARISLSYSGVSLLDSDMYAMDVLAAILGQGASSKLYQNIYKDKGLVHSISASNFTPIDRGVFEVEALLDTEKIKETIKAIGDDIEAVKKNGVAKNELEKIKKQILSDRIYSLQTSSHVAYSQAIDLAFTGDHQFSDKYVDAIRKLSIEDIKAVAVKYFIPEKMTTVILKPKKEKLPEVVLDSVVEEQSVQKKVLSNGLTVLSKEDYGLPMVSVHLVMNGGTREDPKDVSGLSQFTAEWWLKGTKKYSSAALANLVESSGIQLDTFSGKNSFGLNMIFLKEDADQVLKILDEMIKFPAFSKQEFQRIQENMLAAIQLREDNISQKTSELLKETLFQAHPFRLEDGGTKESIGRIAREDVVRFFKKYAVADNMVFSVYGDFDAKRLMPKIEKILISIPQQPLELAGYQEEPVTFLRQEEQTMDKEQAMVMVGFHGPTLKSEDRFGVEMAVSLLGSSFSGRLFNRVREQFGQAYTLGGAFIPGPDMGMIYFYVLTSKEQVDSVSDLVKNEIQKLSEELVPEEELSDMKNYLKGTFKEEIQTISSLSLTNSLDELYGLGFDYYKDYDRLVDAVTREDVQKLAKKYLGSHQATVVVTRPNDSKDSRK